VEGDANVYEAKAWKTGKRIVVANMIDDGEVGVDLTIDGNIRRGR
jgi:hypothetical protein